MIEPSKFSHWLSGFQRNSNEKVQFSLILTIFCSAVYVFGFMLLLWNVASTDRSSEREMDGRDLERLASRMLGFESRLSELSVFEQSMFRFWRGDGDTQEQLRQWYAELPHERRNSLDELYAGILNGEEELRQNLVESKERWNSGIFPAPELAEF